MAKLTTKDIKKYGAEMKEQGRIESIYDIIQRLKTLREEIKQMNEGENFSKGEIRGITEAIEIINRYKKK